MNKSSRQKKPFPWRRYLLIIIVVGLAGRTFRRRPHTTWSAKDVQPTAQMRQSVSQALAPAADIRRVLLISIDTLRADHLGCYGYSRDTSPNIDTLAGQSILYSHAISSAPLTLPSHSSMLTGLTPPHHQVRDNIGYQLHQSTLTLAEMLKQNNFATGAVIAAFALDSQFGLDQGFDTYDDEIAEANPGVFKFANERDAADVTKLANQWLHKHAQEDFFLFVHYYDPHLPYVSHEDFSFRYLFPWPSVRDKYDGEIAYTDHYVGRLIENLKRLKLYDSTLIILTSDHGESLGERKERGHGFFTYHNPIHVPLLVKLPGLDTSATVNEVVGLIDLVPTICKLTGIDLPARVQGQDLCARFRQKSPTRPERFIYSETLRPTIYDGQSLHTLVTNRHKYIHTTRSELYDLSRDPHEKDNIIEKHPDPAEELRSRLAASLDDANEPSTTKVQLDEEALARLRALGYVGAGGVNEDAHLDQNKEDPKDLIAWHEMWQDASNLVFQEKHDQAKPLVLDIIDRLPAFYDPVMPTLAYALAVHADPQLRDPQAALTIARHCAAATNYRNSSDLKALVAACAAAGLHDEAAQALDLLTNLTTPPLGPGANKDQVPE